MMFKNIKAFLKAQKENWNIVFVIQARIDSAFMSFFEIFFSSKKLYSLGNLWKLEQLSYLLAYYIDLCQIPTMLESLQLSDIYIYNPSMNGSTSVIPESFQNHTLGN